MQVMISNSKRECTAVSTSDCQTSSLTRTRWITAIALACMLAAGVQLVQGQSGGSGSGGGASANLPIERIGPNDLIGLTVYDSPEFTRTFRVDADGSLRLPMLQQHIQAAGLYPEQLENAITAALVNGAIFVDPVVSVTVVEYRSRPISVVGAVRTPVTFQDTGNVTLLDAIAQAGGLSDNAGQEVLVSHQETGADGKSTTLIKRVSAYDLYDSVDASSNFELHGGEVIRVPEAGQFYVVGNVKNPGVFTIKDGKESSVLKALALTRGLDRYSQKTAYIYRTEGASRGKTEIPIPIKKIMKRQAPDVAILANDVLYVPEASGRRTTFTVLSRLALVGVGIGTTLLFIYH